MSTVTIAGTDLRLRNAVIRQLDWDPEVETSGVAVTAGDGVVTLTGSIATYAQKLAAERAVKRIRGVRAVANDLAVSAMAERTDTDIARDTVHALALRPSLASVVQATVHHGHLTLTGTVEWLYQKGHAEEAVSHVRGVRGIHNHITVKARPGRRDLQRRIVRALHRQADLDVRGITVEVHEDSVTLSGTTGSWIQRDAAERATGSAPGITRVDNQIIVVPAEPHESEPPDEIC